ncbi:HNH endonuclease [Gymnodinialimonas ulvae]|uniref:HNH endonuclease n=1 Tax=Gymnodinialimonas ulvae TaxID=3126504 RepID=UPI003F6F3B75
MRSKLKTIRNEKYDLQGGKCIYCLQPMWTKSANAFQRAYGLSKGQVRWFQCTAEHLEPVSNGGKTSAKNIAAACRFCNHTRHRTKRPLAPQDYARKVRRRISQGRWLQLGAVTRGAAR